MVHVNAEDEASYTDSRTTVIDMQWLSEPSSIRVTPASALLSQSWVADTSTLTLAISHLNGSVDVNVSE